MKKRILFIGLSCLISGFVFAQTPHKFYKIADSLAKQGKYEKAIPYYNQALKLDQSNEKYFRGRGYSYIELNKLKQGEADYKKALQINPDCSNCYMNLARVAANREQLDTAFSLLTIALEKDSKNASAYYYRARIKAYQGDTFEALFDYNKAIELRPKEPVFIFARGKLNAQMRQNYAAERDFNTAIALDSSNVEFLYGRAELFRMNRTLEKALIDLNKCLQINPKDAHFYTSKGRVLSDMGRYQQSIKALNKSLQIEPKQYAAYLYRATVKYRMEDMDGACADNRKGIKLATQMKAEENVIQHMQTQLDNICDVSKASYYYQRGIAAYNKNNFTRSIQYYNQGLTKFPRSYLTMSFRGNAYKVLEQFNLAIQDYLKCLKNKQALVQEIKNTQSYKQTGPQENNFLMTSGVDLYLSIAYVYSRLQDYPKAIAYQDSTITIITQNQGQSLQNRLLLSMVLNEQGMYYSMNGNYKKAREYFDKSLVINSDNALARINIASLLLQKASKTKYRQVSLQVGSSHGGIAIPFPIFKRQNIEKNILEKALRECNIALNISKKMAYGYLLRAQIKLLLNHPDYCLDALQAQEFGIADVEKKLGIQCK